MDLSLKSLQQRKERGESVQDVITELMNSEEFVNADSLVIIYSNGNELHTAWSMDNILEVLGALEFLKQQVSNQTLELEL